MTKDLAYYKALAYKRFVEEVEDDDGEAYWVATFEELPGCLADGSSRQEAILTLNEVFDEYIVAHIEWRKPIAEPDRVVKARGRVRQIPTQKSTSSGPRGTAQIPGTDSVSYA